MKAITNLTEDQAVTIAATVVTFRAVRSAKIVRPRSATEYNRFTVEVETYSAEESVFRTEDLRALVTIR